MQLFFPIGFHYSTSTFHFLFHQIVHRVTETVHIIRAEGGPETTVFLDRFSELMHCLMTLHPGFPELYDKVVDSIKVRFISVDVLSTF